MWIYFIGLIWFEPIYKQVGAKPVVCGLSLFQVCHGFLDLRIVEKKKLFYTFSESEFFIGDMNVVL